MKSKGQEGNRRRQYIVDKPFQLAYLFDHAAIGLMATVASVFILFFLVFVQLSEERIYHGAWSDTLLGDFVLLCVLVLLLAVYRGVLHSHRIAGPVYRFRRVCAQMARGDLSEEVHLRQKDRLKDLAGAFREMTAGLRGLVEADRRTVAEGRQVLKKLQEAFDGLEIDKVQQERFQALAGELDRCLDAVGKRYVLSPDESSRSE